MELYETEQPEISNVEIIPKTKHLCWLYESDEDRLNVVMPFLVSALSLRKRCLIMTPKAVREEISKSLQEADLNYERYVDTGQIVGMDPEEFLFDGDGDGIDIDVVIHRIQAELSKALAHGWEGISIVGDPSDLLDRAKDEDWLALEYRIDYECFTQPCTMLCLYDQRRASGKLVVALIKTHPVVGLGSILARNPFYARQPITQTL